MSQYHPGSPDPQPMLLPGLSRHLPGGWSRLDPGIARVSLGKAQVGQSGLKDAGPPPDPARGRESPGPLRQQVQRVGSSKASASAPPAPFPTSSESCAALPSGPTLASHIAALHLRPCCHCHLPPVHLPSFPSLRASSPGSGSTPAWAPRQGPCPRPAGGAGHRGEEQDLWVQAARLRTCLSHLRAVRPQASRSTRFHIYKVGITS